MSLYNPDESIPCTSCGENDFLPYKCTLCDRPYCKKHLTDHLPCSKATNRQLSDEERAAFKQGTTLDELFERTMAAQRKTTATSNNNKNQTSSSSSSASSSALAQKYTQGTSSLGSQLLPGFHRYKRIDLVQQNFETNKSGLMRDTTPCVVYFAFDSNNNNSDIQNRQDVVSSSNNNSAAARRERADDDNDDEPIAKEKSSSSNSFFFLLRPVWIDATSHTTLGSLVEKVTSTLRSGPYFPDSIRNRAGNNNSTTIEWKSDSKTGTFTKIDSIEDEKRILETISSNSNQSTTRYFSVEPKVFGKTMSNGCSLVEKNFGKQSDEKVGAIGACILIIDYRREGSNKNDDDELDQVINVFWRKHSLGMLPFVEPPKKVVAAVKENQKEEETNNNNTKDEKKTSTQSKNENNNDEDQDSSSSVAKIKLVDIKWAPSVTRTNPISIGVYANNTTSHSATPANQILITVGFVVDENGELKENSFGYTLKINSSWIVGRIIDEIFGNNDIRNRFVAGANDGNSLFDSSSSSTAAASKNIQLMKLSTGEVFDEGTPLSKYFAAPAGANSFSTLPPTDGIAFAPKGTKMLKSHILSEVQEYGALVKSKKMPKPLMVRSMKECVVQ